MSINIDECDAAGFTPEQIKKIESIARRLSKAGKEASDLGITVFGGSGSGSLRYHDDANKPALLIATLTGCFDGGDGQALEDEDGLLRGET